MKVERQMLKRAYGVIAADIISIQSANEVYRESGMAIECGDGGVIGVVYEEASNETE